MLADLLPLMTDTVRHWREPARDIFGRATIVSSSEDWSPSGVSYRSGQGTISEHRARVVYAPSRTPGRASREPMADATATIWLIDHPHPIAIGDTFELPGAVPLKVMRFECRTMPAGVIHKVSLT